MTSSLLFYFESNYFKKSMLAAVYSLSEKRLSRDELTLFIVPHYCTFLVHTLPQAYTEEVDSNSLLIVS